MYGTTLSISMMQAALTKRCISTVEYAAIYQIRI